MTRKAVGTELVPGSHFADINQVANKIRKDKEFFPQIELVQHMER